MAILQRIRIFYGLQLVFKVSFRVRNRFRIRINNVMSVWQQPWRPSWHSQFVISGDFTFVAG